MQSTPITVPNVKTSQEARPKDKSSHKFSEPTVKSKTQEEIDTLVRQITDVLPDFDRSVIEVSKKSLWLVEFRIRTLDFRRFWVDLHLILNGLWTPCWPTLMTPPQQASVIWPLESPAVPPASQRCHRQRKMPSFSDWWKVRSEYIMEESIGSPEIIFCMWPWLKERNESSPWEKTGCRRSTVLRPIPAWDSQFRRRRQRSSLGRTAPAQSESLWIWLWRWVWRHLR